jgi:hypothetical protein
MSNRILVAATLASVLPAVASAQSSSSDQNQPALVFFANIQETSAW